MRFLCVVGDEIRSTLLSAFKSGSGITCEYVSTFEGAMPLIHQLETDSKRYDIVIVDDDLSADGAVRLVVDAKVRSSTVRSIICTSRPMSDVRSDLEYYCITSKMMQKPVAELLIVNIVDIIRNERDCEENSCC